MKGTDKQPSEETKLGQQASGQGLKNPNPDQSLVESELSEEDLDRVAGGEWNLYGPDNPFHRNPTHKSIPHNTF